MHILHLTVVRELTPGQIKQLSYESRAAQQLDDVVWETIAYQVNGSKQPFVRRLPSLFRPLFLRNLFAWLWLLRHASAYDYVLCRHMTFDPFSFLFAPFIRNRVTVHHAKEIEELKLVRKGWRGLGASMLERWSGRVAVRSAAALLGVTREIRDYEAALYGGGRVLKAGIYPNGICVDEFPVLADKRSSEQIDIAFICGTFSPWHGLDLLLDQLGVRMVRDSLKKAVVLHLIGRLSAEQKEAIELLNRQESAPIKVMTYGVVVDVNDYMEIMERCHLGLDSLALWRKGLTEAATLKVREMLALGLPVYSGHKDTALPDAFPWYVSGPGDVNGIIGFAESSLHVDRQQVRRDATPYIEKKLSLERVVEFLRANVVTGSRLS